MIFCYIYLTAFVFHSFFLDEEALERIMSTKEIKDKPVCIVSVAGKERAGVETLITKWGL